MSSTTSKKADVYASGGGETHLRKTTYAQDIILYFRFWSEDRAAMQWGFRFGVWGVTGSKVVGRMINFLVVVQMVDVFTSLNATDMKLAHMVTGKQTQCEHGAPKRRRRWCEYYLPC